LEQVVLAVVEQVAILLLRALLILAVAVAVVLI
jgi:hypothetical protein